MTVHSAGILMFKRDADAVRVLLAHPGGPFWKRRDHGAWMIPKGALMPGESAEDAARREFAEEMGGLPPGPLLPLGRVRQSGGKCVNAFALEGDFDCARLVSNEFEMEWPPRSGRLARFPEIDRATWFTLDQARERMLPSQAPLLDRLAALLAVPRAGSGRLATRATRLPGAPGANRDGADQQRQRLEGAD